MNEPILQARGLAKHYRDGDRVCRALHGVDLTIDRGAFLAVMGPSGCGKSTLLNVLGLMCPPTQAGTLRLDGVDCLRLSDRGRTALRRDKIGFVFQRFNLLSTISAAGNVKLALRLRGVVADGQVDEVLDSVGLKGLAHRKPGHLSIGEQQRAAIARAVACRPALLLADEPTGNLDSDNTRNVLDLFRRFHAEHGLTVVMITHSLDCAAAADRIIHMRDGRFVDD
ncbi:MAG TPA: ABC transporter ATP-binding protein [Phycisphaerae bacterium]|nr:ABC transporter ATP-binding protein [Phycisphaerae bacterium]